MRKELGLEDIKSIEIDILKKVTDFCNTNNITYYLCAGTMLGAIRHKGFIPWDDDIDIMIPRPDYERFLKLFNLDGLKALSHVNSPNYKYPFAKVEDLNTELIEKEHNSEYSFGVNIDVFPIDGFPETEKDIQRHINNIGFFRMLLSFKLRAKIMDKNFLKSLVVYLVKCFFTIKYLNNKITQIALRYPFGSTKFSGLAVWGYGLNEVCPTDIYNKEVDVEFEGNILKSIEDYDTYLTALYGDYMELPPVKERISNHNFIAYSLK